MYRCHFTRSDHIAMGENLDAATLNEAIEKGHRMLAERSQTDNLDGIEIWDCAAFLYASQPKWPRSQPQPVRSSLCFTQQSVI